MGRAYLDVLVHVSEHIIDLLLETSAQHLVSLVENKALNMARV